MDLNLVEQIRSTFRALPDYRKQGNNQKYAVEDAALSAFSVFIYAKPVLFGLSAADAKAPQPEQCAIRLRCTSNSLDQSNRQSPRSYRTGNAVSDVGGGR